MSFFDAFSRGAQTGGALREMQQRYQQREAEQAAKDAEAERLQQFKTGLSGLDFNDSAAVQQFMQDNPSHLEDITKIMDYGDKSRRQQVGEAAVNFDRILSGGDATAAANYLNENREMIDSLGDPSFTTDSAIEILQQPGGIERLQQMAQGTAYAALGPDKYFQNKQAMMPEEASSVPEYGAVKYDQNGEPFALNKTTGRIERVPGEVVVTKSGPQTVVNNITNSQNEQDKVIAKAAGDIYNGYMQDANTARKNDLTLNRLEKLNEKAFDGVGAGAYKSAAKLAKAVGINVEGLTETELFDSLSNELVLGQTSKLTGVLTDKDMELLATTVPQLSQTKEGRKKLIQVMKEINNASKEQAKLAREYRNSDFGGKPKGQFDDIGFQEYLESQPKSDRFSNLLEGEGTVLRGGSESPAAGTYTSKSGITFKVR